MQVAASRLGCFSFRRPLFIIKTMSVSMLALMMLMVMLIMATMLLLLMMR